MMKNILKKIGNIAPRFLQSLDDAFAPVTHAEQTIRAHQSFRARQAMQAAIDARLQLASLRQSAALFATEEDAKLFQQLESFALQKYEEAAADVNAFLAERAAYEAFLARQEAEKNAEGN